jgi:hypothetical protein
LAVSICAALGNFLDHAHDTSGMVISSIGKCPMIGKYMLLHARKALDTVFFIEASLLYLKASTRHGLECVFSWRAGHEVYGLFSRGRGFCLPPTYFFGFIAQVAAPPSQRYGRIFAQRKDLFFAVIPIPPSPEFSAAGRYVQRKPITIRNAIQRGLGFQVFNLQFRQRHGHP